MKKTKTNKQTFKDFFHARKLHYIVLHFRQAQNMWMS